MILGIYLVYQVHKQQLDHRRKFYLIYTVIVVKYHVDALRVLIFRRDVSSVPPLTIINVLYLGRPCLYPASVGL